MHQDPANMCRGQHKLINRQKAPSAKRCIKTIGLDADADIEERQKAPSPKRCIKTIGLDADADIEERQKAPSPKRCILGSSGGCNGSW